jgi:heat shock protein HslJ
VPRLRLVRVVSRQPAAAGAESGPLAGSEWRLQRIAGSTDQAWTNSGITARFHLGGGWVDGFAGCDSYLGALTADGEKIKIAAPAIGPALCAGAAAARQRTYLHALAKAQSYTVTGDSLELKLLDGGSMRFIAAPG